MLTVGRGVYNQPVAVAPSLRLSDLPRLIHREVVLLAVLSAIAAGSILVTQWAESSNRTLQATDAAAWFERGRARLATGQTGAAVTALGRAVTRRPDEWLYASTLADALRADDQVDAARQLLLDWRLRRPEDPEVNTQLARLEAGSGTVAAAIGYYEGALHGRWAEPASESRLELRRELIRYLLGQGQSGPALAQALVLAANLPDAPGAHLESGRLFLETGDATRASSHFVRALRLDPGNLAAGAGATEAAFVLGDYAAAVEHARGLTDRPSLERARIAAAVIANDSLAPRLSVAERERRLAGMVDRAGRQLAVCRAGVPNTTPLAERTAGALAAALTTFRGALSAARLRESTEVIERGLRLVDQALQHVRQRCPPLDAQGEALRRVVRRHEATR